MLKKEVLIQKEESTNSGTLKIKVGYDNGDQSGSDSSLRGFTLDESTWWWDPGEVISASGICKNIQSLESFDNAGWNGDSFNRFTWKSGFSASTNKIIVRRNDNQKEKIFGTTKELGHGDPLIVRSDNGKVLSLSLSLSLGKQTSSANARCFLVEAAA